MTDISLHNKLCASFCPYYKPAKSDELACMGFLILERLLKKGRHIPFDETEKAPDAATVETLVQNVCVICPFYESDCDFVKGGEKSLPCGGYMLLGHLLEKNIISVDDIKNII